MIAQRIDLLALHEMVIARAVPNPTPAFAAVAVCVMGRIYTRDSGFGTRDSGLGTPFDSAEA
jgi:hypothetical protein